MDVRAEASDDDVVRLTWVKVPQPVGLATEALPGRRGVRDEVDERHDVRRKHSLVGGHPALAFPWRRSPPKLAGRRL